MFSARGPHPRAAQPEPAPGIPVHAGQMLPQRPLRHCVIQGRHGIVVHQQNFRVLQAAGAGRAAGCAGNDADEGVISAVAVIAVYLFVLSVFTLPSV